MTKTTISSAVPAEKAPVRGPVITAAPHPSTDAHALLQQRVFEYLAPGEVREEIIAEGFDLDRRLPPTWGENDTFDVFVHDEKADWAEHEWHVYADGAISEADFEDTREIAVALLKAAWQADILTNGDPTHVWASRRSDYFDLDVPVAGVHQSGIMIAPGTGTWTVAIETDEGTVMPPAQAIEFALAVLGAAFHAQLLDEAGVTR